ncbi:MAG TPA: YncE family protein [Candidatus Polarisedimenticolia bacterium]|nr:YncE family protein [Candidatus Polarisedimenticolia bacterium]
MKNLLAVGMVALGTLGVLMMRNTKSAVAASQAPSRELAPLQLIQKIPVPGVAGRIDHFTAFPKRRLLIFAALGNNSMEIVNTFEAKVVQSIKGLNEPQGVLYVPGFDRIFVANAGSGVVKVYDGKTYALRKSIALGAESDTDNLRWDEDSKRVFVGIVGGIAMIDAATEAHVGKDLKGSGGHSESFQLEKKGSRIFVNVPEDGSVVNVIDRKTGELTKWDLNGVKANYPMALHEDDHRLFVVTRRPPFLMVLDTNTGKEVARVPIGGSCDDVYYDAERKRIYAIAGEGFISVVQQHDPDHYTLSANIPSAIGVRTGIFYGTSLYVGVPAGGLEPARIWNYGVPE